MNDFVVFILFLLGISLLVLIGKVSYDINAVGISTSYALDHCIQDKEKMKTEFCKEVAKRSNEKI